MQLTPVIPSDSQTPKLDLSLGGLGSGLVWVDLLSILVETNSWWGSTVSATFTGTDTMRELLAMLVCYRNGSSTKVLLLAALTYRTILPWMAQETQYCSLRYILGTVYSGNTDASEISPRDSKLAK